MFNAKEINYMKNDIKNILEYLYRIKLKDIVTNNDVAIIKIGANTYDHSNLSDTMLNKTVISYSFNKNNHILNVVLEGE